MDLGLLARCARCGVLGPWASATPTTLRVLGWSSALIVRRDGVWEWSSFVQAGVW